MIRGRHGQCLCWSVQKSEHLVRSLYLSLPGVIFCVATSLLMFAAASVYAGEPIMTLAMNQSPEKYSPPSFLQLAFGTNSFYFDTQSDPSEVVSINTAKVDLFVPVNQIEVQTNIVQGESFRLVRENSRSNKPLTVAAGYGQIWDEKSTLRKIYCGYQDPGCAYVSASFSF